MSSKVRTINFAGIDDPAQRDELPSSIPEGWYRAIITDVKLKQSPQTHSDYYLWELMPIARYPNAIHKDFRLTYATSLRERTIYMLQRFIEAATGCKPTEKIDFNPEGLLERSLYVRVRNLSYGYQLRSTVKEVAHNEPV